MELLFKHIRKEYLVVLMFSFCVWLVFSYFTTSFNGVDEGAHYQVITIYSRGAWPVLPAGTSTFGKTNTYETSKTSTPTFFDLEAKNNINPQAQHPPLYYWTGVVFYRVGDLIFGHVTSADQDKIYMFTRLNSFFYYAIALVFVYKALELYFSKTSALLMTSATSLQLNLLSSAVTINNDIGAAAIASIFFYFLLAFLRNRKKLTLKSSFLFGVLTGIAVLFKLYNVILIPVFLTTFVLLEKSRWRDLVKKFSIYLLTIFVALLPWFLVSYAIYGQFIVDNYTALDSKGVSLLSLALTVCKDLGLSILGWSGFSTIALINYLFAPYLVVWLYFLLLGGVTFFGFLFLSRHWRKYPEVVATLTSCLVFGGLFFAFRSYTVIAYAHYFPGVAARYYLMFLLPGVVLVTFGLRFIKIIRIEKLSLYVFGFGIYYLIVHLLVHF